MTGADIPFHVMNTNETQLRILKLLQYNINKKCANCMSDNVKFVCLDFGTFVCHRCQQIHDQFGHQVQRLVSQIDQVYLNKLNGNSEDSKLFVHKWVRGKSTLPSSEETDDERVKEFIAAKCIERLVKSGEVGLINNVLDNIIELDLRCRLHQQGQLMFNHLLKLEKLNLSWNKLHSHANLACIFLLPSLYDLNISQCNISSIDIFDIEKSRIQKLEIQFNSLKQKSAQFLCQLPCLTSLNMSNCQLKLIPSFSRNSTVIRQLNLSNNQFENTQNIDNLFVLPSLRDLSLTNCNIQCIQLFLVSESQIQQLRIDSNKLNYETMNIISSLPYLSELYMQKCQLNNFPHLLSPSTCITRLDFSKNHFQLDNATKNNIHQMTDCVNIEFNRFILSFNQLETLILSNCNMVQVPNFPYLAQIKVLDISRNPFNASLNIASIFSLTFLQELNISECQIGQIDMFDISKSKINWLDICYNFLPNQSIQLICRLPYLQQLFLLGNEKIISEKSASVILGNETLHTLYINNIDYQLLKGGLSLRQFYTDFDWDVSWLPALQWFNNNEIQQQYQREQANEQMYKQNRRDIKSQIKKLVTIKYYQQILNQSLIDRIATINSQLLKCCSSLLNGLEQ